MPTATADRSLLRAINRAAVLRAVMEAREISRADIARATGISQVTVGSIVADLIDRDVLVEGDDAPSRGGRPSRLLLLNGSAYVAAGVKLTEDRVVAALTDLEAKVVVELEQELADREPESVVRVVAETVRQLLAQAAVTEDRLLGLGLGMAGVIDTAQGSCRYSPFLGWRDVPIAQLLGDALGAPVLVDNDVNTLALAERWFGVGAGEPDFILVTVGRGIGFASIADGALHRGAGGAGEFGHTVVDGSERPCDCGRLGCLEATVGEAGLLAAAREAAPDARRRLHDLAGLHRVAREVPAVRQVLDDAAIALGRGLANLVNLFAPRLVIVSGEAVETSPQLVDAAVDVLADRVFPGLEGSFDVVVDALPQSAWARGAASLVLGEVFESPTRSQLDLHSRLVEGAAS